MTKMIIILVSDVTTAHDTDPCTHLHHRFYRVEANGDGLDRAGTVADPAFYTQLTTSIPQRVTRNPQLTSIPDHGDAIF